ncbi:MAG: DNA polymerase III subunit chi [Planktomarina sp.]
MGEAYFYHLTRQSQTEALLEILPKCLSQNWRVELRTGQADRLEWLDEKLWLGPDDGFLPHGIAGGDHDALQPILLTSDGGDTAAPPHDCLICVDGAAVTDAHVRAATRTCIVFEAADPAQMSTARSQWVSLTEAGCTAKYWSQETGRWQLKAEKG